jgi:hypothetical protein
VRLIRRTNQPLPCPAAGSDFTHDAVGGVDGFDEDEAESKGHNGAVVLGRLLAAERNSLEALELTDKLLDAGARPIERFRKECRPGRLMI